VKSNLESGSSSIILLGGLLLLSASIVAGYFYYTLVINQTTEQPKVAAPVSPGLAEVLVTVREIEAGSVLDVSMFRRESMPEAQLVPNPIYTFDEIKGAYAASYVAARQPLSGDFVTFKPPVNQIQANISEGYRAVSFAVDATTSVEGWARAGAKVDVLLASALNNRPAITVIIQNAKVLSAGRSTSSDVLGPPASTVTIMVTTEESAKLQLASSSGALSLALRGDDDPVETSDNRTVTIESVLGVLPVQTPQAIPSEGTVKVDGKSFVIINGKLVPESKLTDK
jgi:pilus assembly protein CpaB